MALFKGKQISELSPLVTDAGTLLAGQKGITTGSVTVQSVLDLVPETDISGKQDVLISGTNIKTINSLSLLGSGNISIAAGDTSFNVRYEDIFTNVSFFDSNQETVQILNGFFPADGGGSLTFTRPAGVLIVRGQRVEVPSEVINGVADAEYLWDINLDTLEVVRTYYTFDNSVPYEDPAAGFTRFAFVDTDTTEISGSGAWESRTFGLVIQKPIHFEDRFIKIGPDAINDVWGFYAKTTFASSRIPTGLNSTDQRNSVIIHTGVGSYVPFQTILIGCGDNGVIVPNSGSNQNIGIGFGSLENFVYGSNNVVLGGGAFSNRSGDGNVAIGHAAMRSQQPPAGTADCLNNTLIGRETGLNSFRAGSNNTLIGYQADTAASTTNNTIVLGNSSIASLRCAVTTITSLSDQRDKANIVDLPLGLDFINSVRPVKFTWNTRDGAKVGIEDAGFIAQELKQAEDAAGVAEWMQLVCEADPNKLNATPGRLLPVLVKAIQELAAKVAILEEQLANA